MESTRRKPKNCRVTAAPHGGVCSAVSCYIFYKGVHELGVDVGEPFKICLVDVGNDQLIWRRQHRLSSREELIEVFSPFAALQGERKAEKKRLKKASKATAGLSGYMQGMFLRSSWGKIFFSVSWQTIADKQWCFNSWILIKSSQKGFHPSAGGDEIKRLKYSALLGYKRKKEIFW